MMKKNEFYRELFSTPSKSDLLVVDEVFRKVKSFTLPVVFINFALFSMCRLTVYKGREILLGDLIVKPDNSLMCQSRDAHYHPGVTDKNNERNILVNGDGFGVAWYTKEPAKGSCVFKFVTPAWSNHNLRNLGEYVSSSLIMAHIRAATSGRDPFEKMVVSSENCHPFKYGRWTFMHNGGIPQFGRIKRSLVNLLKSECYDNISGCTDSEHIFALFLSLLPDMNKELTVEETTNAVDETISTILTLCHEHGITNPCSLNMVFSDGVNVIATRFRNGPEMPPSLYYNYGCGFVCENGNFVSNSKESASEIVISSAPLSRSGQCKGCDNDNLPEASIAEWTLVPKDHMLICVGDKSDHSRVDHVLLQAIRIIPRSKIDLSKSPSAALFAEKTSLRFVEGVEVLPLSTICKNAAIKAQRGTPRPLSCARATLQKAAQIAKSIDLTPCKEERGLGCIMRVLGSTEAVIASLFAVLVLVAVLIPSASIVGTSI